MRRVLLLLICAICFSPILRAQKAQDEIACFAEWTDNAAHKKKLWNGYEISRGPARNPDEVEYKCTAAIYNSAGRVVFRTSGFNVVLDEDLTGEDFDGDGEPEVVFKTDRAEEITVAGATSSFRFRRNHISFSRLPWKAGLISRKTKTGKW